MSARFIEFIKGVEKLNLLKELGKSDNMRGSSSILSQQVL